MTVSEKQRLVVQRAEENKDSYENKVFGHMYAKAVRDMVYKKDDSLFKFMEQLERAPVSIETFLDHHDYLGSTDIVLWPEVRKAIVEISQDWWKGPEEGRIEAVLCGSTSTGKTSIAMITVLYHLYLISCLKVPQNVYGLPKEISIVFAIMAAKPHVTKRVLYAPLRKLIASMPYFQANCKFDPYLESEMYFKEKNIRIVQAGGDADAILGEAVIAGICDEINFMQVVQNSRKSEVSTGRSGIFDQATLIYETITRRKKSRFLTKGPQIGIIIVSSSTRYKGDFTDKRLKHIKESNNPSDKLVYVYNKKQYEVWPKTRYSGETFKLLIGNDVVSDTRILREGDVPPEGSHIEDIPIEYLSDFEVNAHSALRDIVGISDSAISPFIKRRYKVYECIEAGKQIGLESILVEDNVTLGTQGMPVVRKGHYCVNPTRPRYVHIDLSLTHSRCGIVMLRFDGMKSCEREGGFIEVLPVVAVEMACTIEPDGNNEIQMSEIRTFIRTIKDIYGYPIKSVSYDTFQSMDSIQMWRKQGMISGPVSIVRTSGPYKQLRDAINDVRVLMYDQPVLIEELFGLEEDQELDKILKPVNGFKDLVDALCGAYTTLLKMRSSWSALAEDQAIHNAQMRAEFEERFDAARNG
jgi:hypothetical protein